MYFLVFAASIALAIPTFGGSLALFLLFRSWWDNGAIKLILKETEGGLEDSEKRLHGVNRSAIRKIFSLYGTDKMEAMQLPDGRTFYNGMIRHPKNGKEFLLGIFRKPITGEIDFSTKSVETSFAKSIIADVHREMEAKRRQKATESPDVSSE